MLTCRERLATIGWEDPTADDADDKSPDGDRTKKSTSRLGGWQEPLESGQSAITDPSLVGYASLARSLTTAIASAAALAAIVTANVGAKCDRCEPVSRSTGASTRVLGSQS